MKKMICVLLAVLFLLCTASALGDSLFVDNRETDKVYPERLNLRSEPSKNGAILGLYYTGAEVANLGAENEEYTKVEIGGVTGYMATEYLITLEEAVARYGEGSGFGDYRAAEIDLSGLWMKEVSLLVAREDGAQTLASLANGTPVALVGVLDPWAYVCAEIDGAKTYGYVPLDVLTDVGALKVCIVAGSRADTQTILYDAPNSKAKEIMRIKNGTACFNLFGRKEGEWRRVRVGGISGWIKYTQTDNLVEIGGQPRNTVPYYPLLMQTKKEAMLYSAFDDNALSHMQLAKGVKVEVLAEREDDVYVRTFEGGAGAYDCGDYGYMKLADLSLAPAGESVGVAQADNDDLPVIVLKASEADAEMIGALCGGAQVRIVEYTQTDYVQIAMNGVRGYIPKNEIRILSGENPEISDRIPQRAITMEEVTLLDEPSAKGKKGETVPVSSRVYVLGKFGEWAFVRYAGDPNLRGTDTGEDHTGFVKLAALNVPASSTHLTAFVKTDKVNLRSEDSTSGEIIGRARTDERLRVADYGSEWSVVVTPDNVRGYIKTEYLEFE